MEPRRHQLSEFAATNHLKFANIYLHRHLLGRVSILHLSVSVDLSHSLLLDVI